MLDSKDIGVVEATKSAVLAVVLLLHRERPCQRYKSSAVQWRAEENVSAYNTHLHLCGYSLVDGPWKVSVS